MDKKIIVSFTSYGKRICNVHNVIDSILKQTMMPNRIILYIDGKYKDLIDERLENMTHNGIFEIRFVPCDLGPHTKYYYAFQDFPNDIVITIDDDMIYEKELIERLVVFYEKCPGCIVSNRTHLIRKGINGEVESYDKWIFDSKIFIGIPRMDLCATGVGGVLYPPGLLSKKIFDVDTFRRICPYADDLWLKTIELIDRIPIVGTDLREIYIGIKGVFEDGLCTKENANGGNDMQLLRLIEHAESFNCHFYEEVFSDPYSPLDYVWQNGYMSVFRQWLDECIDKKGLTIFGIGVVAERLLKYLENENIDSIVNAFVVSEIGSETVFYGRQVYTIREKIDYNDMIIALNNIDEAYRIKDMLSKAFRRIYVFSRNELEVLKLFG